MAATAGWLDYSIRTRAPRDQPLIASVERWDGTGFVRRSRYNAGCVRRKTFSAVSWARDRIANDISAMKSRVTPRIVRSRMRALFGMT